MALLYKNCHNQQLKLSINSFFKRLKLIHPNNLIIKYNTNRFYTMSEHPTMGSELYQMVTRMTNFNNKQDQNQANIYEQLLNNNINNYNNMSKQSKDSLGTQYKIMMGIFYQLKSKQIKSNQIYNQIMHNSKYNHYYSNKQIVKKQFQQLFKLEISKQSPIMQSLTLNYLLPKMIEKYPQSAIQCFLKILNFTPFSYESFSYKIRQIYGQETSLIGQICQIVQNIASNQLNFSPIHWQNHNSFADLLKIGKTNIDDLLQFMKNVNFMYTLVQIWKNHAKYSVQQQNAPQLMSLLQQYLSYESTIQYNQHQQIKIQVLKIKGGIQKCMFKSIQWNQYIKENVYFSLLIDTIKQQQDALFDGIYNCMELYNTQKDSINLLLAISSHLSEYFQQKYLINQLTKLILNRLSQYLFHYNQIGTLQLLCDYIAKCKKNKAYQSPKAVLDLIFEVKKQEECMIVNVNVNNLIAKDEYESDDQFQQKSYQKQIKEQYLREIIYYQDNYNNLGKQRLDKNQQKHNLDIDMKQNYQFFKREQDKPNYKQQYYGWDYQENRQESFDLQNMKESSIIPQNQNKLDSDVDSDDDINSGDGEGDGDDDGDDDRRDQKCNLQNKMMNQTINNDSAIIDEQDYSKYLSKEQSSQDVSSSSKLSQFDDQIKPYKNGQVYRSIDVSELSFDGLQQIKIDKILLTVTKNKNLPSVYKVNKIMRQIIFQNTNNIFLYLCANRNQNGNIAKHFARHQTHLRTIQGKQQTYDRYFSVLIQKGDKQYSRYNGQGDTRHYLWGIGFQYVIEWIISIAKGINELENLGIFHCDLKFRNTIKISEHFKIIDFDRAFVVQKIKHLQKNQQAYQSTRKIIKNWLKSQSKQDQRLFISYLFYNTENEQLIAKLLAWKQQSKFDNQIVDMIMKQLKQHMFLSHLQQFTYLIMSQQYGLLGKKIINEFQKKGTIVKDQIMKRILQLMTLLKKGKIKYDLFCKQMKLQKCKYIKLVQQ